MGRKRLPEEEKKEKLQVSIKRKYIDELHKLKEENFITSIANFVEESIAKSLEERRKDEKYKK